MNSFIVLNIPARVFVAFFDICHSLQRMPWFTAVVQARVNLGSSEEEANRMKQKGYMHESEQVCRCWKMLKACRYAAKKQNNNSGSSPSTFQYFDIMNDINFYPTHQGVE